MRHDLFNKLLGLSKGFLSVQLYFRYVIPQIIPDGPDDDIAFLVEQERPPAFPGRLVNGLVQMHQIIEIPLQFLHCPGDAGSADYDSHVLGNVQLGYV